MLTSSRGKTSTAVAGRVVLTHNMRMPRPPSDLPYCALQQRICRNWVSAWGQQPRIFLNSRVKRTLHARGLRCSHRKILTNSLLDMVRALVIRCGERLFTLPISYTIISCAQGLGSPPLCQCKMRSKPHPGNIFWTRWVSLSCFN